MSSSPRLPGWEQLAVTVPDVVAPMRRYLDQLACILRPGSVNGADLALRSLTGFLVEQAPEVRFIADLRRRHIEDFRTWLTARPGRRTARLTPGTLAHRLGTLRMFFVRISDWDWPEAPARIPIIPADCRGTIIRCLKPSTTRPPRNSCAPHKPILARSPASWWKCCCAPDYASVSSPDCKPTRSC